MKVLASSVLFLAATTSAFMPQPVRRTTTSLPSSVNDELQDLEKARANFEFLMKTEGLLKDDAILPLPHIPEEYTPRPLTESSRQRRELEMDMIASLADSDDGIEELMALWILERGVDAADDLQQMAMECSPGLVKEEAILRDLMEEYGIHWAEPVSRLASLLYFKGNTLESEQWCEVALAVKPWHFEVIHTHVLNALRNQDMVAAIRWQRKALPPLNEATNHKARKAWVKQALKDARASMEKAEMAAQEQKPRVFVRDSDVWQ